MSVDEFLAWQGEADLRYELIGGAPVAMSPPSRQHSVLVFNLGQALASALSKRPLCVGMVEAGLASPTAADTYYQADLVVACSKKEGEPEEPLVIVEVLSPTTEAHDRKVKLVDYRQLESVEEILLVDQDRAYCEVHRRLDGDRWLVDMLIDPTASVRLESLDADLPLASIYRGVAFENA